MNKVRLIIIDSEENSRVKLKQHLEEKDFIKVQGEYKDLVDGYNAVIKEKPHVVIIDISNNSDLALEIVSKISAQNKSCMVFVISSESSTGLVLKAMRSGAREFITKPLDFNELDFALQKSKNILSIEKEDNDQCKIYTVFSNKGGIGKTSIAVNLAVSLADLTKKKVALVDLNLQLGDVTTFLDINPSFDISYVVNNLSRVDESFLLSSLEKYKDRNLYVLADPPYLEQAEEITSEQIGVVLNALKSTFSYIIIDTNNSFDGKTLSALDASDLILLVSVINLPSIRNTQRCLDLFGRLGYNIDKIKLVVNRYMSNDEIKIEDVEEVLNHSIYWKIPNNYYSIMSSINKGIPVSHLNPASNVTKSFRELAALLSGTVILNEEPVNQQMKKSLFNFSFFKSLFSAFSAKKK